MSEEEHVAAIAALNDACRAEPGAGWMLTAGVQALGAAALAQVVAAVKDFAAFTEDNNPHGERDFGAFELGGQRLFWKIDYYDLDLCMASPDPADPAVTKRVLTLMLAEVVSRARSRVCLLLDIAAQRRFVTIAVARPRMLNAARLL